MTALRLALTELRRLTAGTLPRLGLAAMILVPTLYGGLYLFANKDPYAGLSRVPAAIVVEDTGTRLASGERLQAGPNVAHDLLASKSFDWHEVSRTEAISGVQDDRYDFALVVPADFSAALASSAAFTPRQARLEVTTNDANNYLAHTIAGSLVAEVTKSVAAQVSSTAASQMLLGFSTTHDKVQQAVTGADRLRTGVDTADKAAHDLSNGAAQLAEGQRRLVTGTSQLAQGARGAAAGATTLRDGTVTLATGLSTLDQSTATLPAQSRQLSDGARQVAEGNAKVADAGTRAATASRTFVDAVTGGQGQLADVLRQQGFTPDQISTVLAEAQRLSTPVTQANGAIQQTAGQLTALSQGASQVAAGADRLAASAGSLHDGIHQAAGGAARARDGAGSLATGLTRLDAGAHQLVAGQRSALTGADRLASGATQLASGLDQLGAGATTLRDGLSAGLRSIPNPSQAARKAVAETIGNPVAVQNTSQASAGSYGAGLAPFFLSLALWIGAYVLFLLVKPLSTRALAAGQPAWRIALGGWLAPALFGVAQAVLVFLVVVFGLGIHAQHPVGVLALMGFTSMTFMAVLHALAARLGSVGKFLGLVLMVLQLVSAGGTFPWQTLPVPLHPLHHVLPMSYAIDGIRHLMYGGSLASVGLDVAVLSAYLLVAFAWASRGAARSGTWTAARVKPELVL